MKRVVSTFALVLAVCLLLSGCTVTPFRAVESLMRPPAYSDADQSLISAFNDSSGPGTAFCSPVSGDFTSAIIIESLGGSFSKQALIFYSYKASPGTVMVNFFDYTGEEWKSSADLSGYGTGVESVKFVDMDNDGFDEVIVCWRSGLSAGKVLSVYRRDGDTAPFREISNETYSVMTCVDIDSDNNTELLTVNQTTANGIVQNTASVFKIINGEIMVMGSVKLDSNVSVYVSANTEKINENSPMRVFIDAQKGENQMITEVLYWSSSDSSLKAPFVDPETFINTRTQRYELIPCTDVNNDGSIDIPVQKAAGTDAAQSGESVAEINTAGITTWYEVSGDELERVCDTYVDTENGYIFFFNDGEAENIKVAETKANCRVFSHTDEKTGQAAELFSILSLSNEEWEKNNNDNYTVLLQTETGVICAYITAYGQQIGIGSEKMAERISQFK